MLVSAQHRLHGAPGLAQARVTYAPVMRLCEIPYSTSGGLQDNHDHALGDEHTRVRVIKASLSAMRSSRATCTASRSTSQLSNFQRNSRLEGDAASFGAICNAAMIFDT